MDQKKVTKFKTKKKYINVKKKNCLSFESKAGIQADLRNIQFSLN